MTTARISISVLRNLRPLGMVAAIATFAACGNGTDAPSEDRFDVRVVSVQPEVGFAPLDVRLEAVADPLVAGIDLSDVTFDWTFGDEESASGASVTHTFEQAGIYEIGVRGEQRSGGSLTAFAEAGTSIEVLAAPDLTVGIPVVNPVSFDSSQPLRVSVDLTNRAGAIPSSFLFDVSTYLVPSDTEQAPALEVLQASIADGTSFRIHTTPFSGFEGENAQQNLDDADIRIPENVPSGTYRLLVFADPAGAISELNEVNNGTLAAPQITYSDTSVSGPDLQVRDVRAFPSRVDRIAAFTYEANLRNGGNESALFVTYETYLSRGDAILSSDDLLIDSGEVPNVPANGVFALDNIQITVDPPITQLGEYTVLVVADPAETIVERNEGNNVGASAAPIVVTDDPIPGVDIVVDSFRVAPENTYLRGSVEVSTTVTNQGVEEIERQFICRTYLSEDDEYSPETDVQLDSFTVAPLLAGEAADIVRVSDIPGFFEPGEFTPIVFCDAGQAIAESNEDNNVRAANSPITISVDAVVDLQIESFSVSPTTVTNGSQVQVSLQICNRGSNGSTPSVARVFLSDDNELDFQDRVLLQANVSPINAQECIVIDAPADAICNTFVSNYSAIALVDATNTVPELDESNNSEVFAEPITIEGLICDCSPDEFEPNDSPGTAQVIDPERALYAELTMCDTAADWYRVPLLRGETIRIAADFENARGNLNMVLYATDFATVLATSNSQGDREEVSYFRVPERGDYLLGVTGTTAADRNVYDLSFDVSSPAAGTDLTVLNVRLNETEPVLGQTIEVSFDVVNLGDTRTMVPMTTRLFLSDDTDIDPVDDLQLGQLIIGEVDDRASRTVEVDLPDNVEGGTYYIGVVADARNDIPGELNESNNTGLSSQFRISAECFDALEPNNDLDHARMIEILTEPPITLAGLLVCAGNRDFYEVCVDDGDYLTFRVNFDQDEGDVDLKLYNQSGSEIARSEGIGNSEFIEIDYVPGAQCYRLEVFVANPGAEVPYALEIDTGRASEELQCNNDAEPNGGFGDAAPLRDWLDADLAICPDADEDHFWIQLAAGTQIEISLAAATGESAAPTDLRLRLSGPSRNFLANTVSSTEVIRYTVAIPGRHYIRVRSNGDGPRNQPYRIRIDGISGTDLVPSELTLNPPAAAPDTLVRYDFLLSNTRDLASGPINYTVSISDDPVRSADDTVLRDEDVAGLDGLSDRWEGAKIRIPSTILDSGTYYILVEIDPDDDIDEFVETNNFELEPIEVVGRCVGDRAEPNDFSFDATLDSEIAGVDLTLCPDDVDWFQMNASMGQTISATLTFSEADLDMYLYYDSATGLMLVRSADSNTPNESLSHVAQSSGRYFLEVVGFDAATNAAYDLSLTVSP